MTTDTDKRITPQTQPPRRGLRGCREPVCQPQLTQAEEKRKMSSQQDEKPDPTNDEQEQETKQDQGFQTIWGIKPKDRFWFSLITITGGTAGAAAVIVLTITEMDKPKPNEILTDTFTGITAAYTTAGFVALVVINVKETILSIAERIRDNNKKNRMITKEEGRQEGLKQGRQEGREQTISNLRAKAEATGNPSLMEFLEKEAENPE